MPFGDKGQFQKLLVGILKRLGPEMDWNLVAWVNLGPNKKKKYF